MRPAFFIAICLILTSGWYKDNIPLKEKGYSDGLYPLSDLGVQNYF